MSKSDLIICNYFPQLDLVNDKVILYYSGCECSRETNVNNG